jgi:uncharacterized protein YebE (UPF0316 family)
MNFDSGIFNWVILPILIYFARICDVSLGTFRIISLSKGLKTVAPVLGFFEILIWLMAIRQIFSNLNNPVCYLAYAGGFASGIYTGMWIENKVAMGIRVVRIITRREANELVQTLRKLGYAVTSVDAEGNDGAVKLIFTIVKRADIPDIIELIKEYNPKASYSIEDVRAASAGAYPAYPNGKSNFWSQFLKYEKKAK